MRTMSKPEITYELGFCGTCWYKYDSTEHLVETLKSIKHITCLKCGETRKITFESFEALARRNKKRREQRKKK
jgi:Fe2+ or Zn2+ uptake regulation protein